jgi:replicative DNA helicase
MRRQKELDAMGAAYISDLTDGLNRAFAGMESHVALLQEKAALRRIIGACHDASVRAYAEDSSAQIAESLMNHIERKP